MYEDDEFFSDLLERDFLEARINGEHQALAYLWLKTNHQNWEHRITQAEK